MNSTQALRHDHALLRQKLHLLSSALQAAPEARPVVRDMAFSLLRVLEEHARREGDALRDQAPHRAIGREVDHAEVLSLLRSIYRLMGGGVRVSVPMVVLRLSNAIEQLQEQMDEQERTLFSALGEIAFDAVEPLTIISEAMSVNETLQRFPRTEPVFERLQVNRLREGYDSLDEFAWRHGIEVSEFLEELRHVAVFQRP